MKKKEFSTFISNGTTYYRKQINGKRLTATSPELLREKIKQHEKLSKLGKEKYFDITLGEYLMQWYESIEGEIRPHTYESYGNYAKKILSHQISSVRLLDVTPEQIERCLKDFSTQPLPKTGKFPSQTYINNVLTVFKLVFKKAKKELIFDRNYAEDIHVKSKKKIDDDAGRRALSIDEIENVLNFDHCMRPMWLFMMLCGLMSEEVVPLLWKDITYKEDTKMYIVNINKTALLASTGPTIVCEGETKTPFRKRSLPIPYPLSEWVAEEFPKHIGNELIFKNKNQEIFSKSALRHRWISYIRDLDIHVHNKKNKFDPTRTSEDKKLTIKNFTPYDLRHTYATLLADLEIADKKLTALMGHSTAETAQKYYIDRNKLSTYNDVKKLGENMKKISGKCG